MLKCLDCGHENVSGMHGCNWTGKDTLAQRVTRLADRVTALEEAALPPVTDLLRCPFCGGPPVVHTSDANDVKCASCAMGWVLRSVWQRRTP